MDSTQFQQIASLNLVRLNIELAHAMQQPVCNYESICKVKDQGLYIIFTKNEILYVGKTTRMGKIRMRELTADFRSHTFNKKLLSERLKEFGFVFKVLKNETKNTLINEGAMSEEIFKSHQSEVNQIIRSTLSFKFLSVSDLSLLTQLEHFAIAVLHPKYND